MTGLTYKIIIRLIFVKDAMTSPVLMDRHFVWPAVRVAGVFVPSGNASLPNLNPESQDREYFSTQICISSSIQTLTAYCNQTHNLTVFQIEFPGQSGGTLS